MLVAATLLLNHICLHAWWNLWKKRIRNRGKNTWSVTVFRWKAPVQNIVALKRNLGPGIESRNLWNARWACIPNTKANTWLAIGGPCKCVVASNLEMFVGDYCSWANYRSSSLESSKKKIPLTAKELSGNHCWYLVHINKDKKVSVIINSN